jgi:hypothetical protein
MELEKGAQYLWYESKGRLPIRIGIPTELTLAEAQAALQEFVDFIADLAALPHSNKVTVGAAYQIAREEKTEGH